MRQQLADHDVALRGKTCQYVFEVGIRVMPVELGALDQTHDSRTTFARTQ